MSEESDEELRLRYLDWCSVKIVRRFFELTPDEVWQRAQQADARSESPEDLPLAELPLSPLPGAEAGFLNVVRKTALILAQELHLPAFEAWKASYLADPEPYRRDLLEMGDPGASSPP